MYKRILFLTGTRADFGKLKSLINKVEESKKFEAHIFVTGMHMLAKYGMTAIEVEKCGFKSIYKYINQNTNDTMDIVLSKTIHGLSDYVKEIKPDMIVVHGDRVEAMAGAIVGSLNNIIVSHIEGGEISGTIDELIRHAVSKLSHIHFVCNERAKLRLKQLGELASNIHIIGSPDVDAMASDKLPTLDDVRDRYNIPFKNYGIFMYHPVTTDLINLPTNIKNSVDAILNSDDNYVVIYPNNDHGSNVIINELKRLKENPKFKVFPSIRFECFLTLLKESKYIIGNSSAGIREAPFYGITTINLGNRQSGRSSACSILNMREDKEEILTSIKSSTTSNFTPLQEFGEGNSDERFIEAISTINFWNTEKQKVFIDAVD
jgi:UDP-N-acetylglucosamine 2-epimerase (hydrolysing)